MGAPYHPELFKAMEPMLAAMANTVTPAVYDVETRRVHAKTLLEPLFQAIPRPPDVDVKVYHAKASDGFSIPIHRFAKAGSTAQGTLPAIFHTHGGGYIALDVSIASNVLATTAATTGIQVFSVDYRLAPEHPFPTPPEDCYTALLWLHEHAAEFNVDPARIAIYGESAGGGLAAGVAIMARDRKLTPPLAKQVLVYPMIDDRNLSPSPMDNIMLWKCADNITGWTAYVGENAGKEGISPYAAAARVESVEGLPSTYIDVGTLDHFRDEDILYASRLAAANIEVELHVYPGVIHAFELLAQGTDLVNKALANRVKALSTI